MAVVDEDRLGNAMLARHPFGHLVVTADELLEAVFLEHAPDRDLALALTVDLVLHGIVGVARQVRQGRRRDLQRLDRRAADRVGLGLLQLLGHRRRRLAVGQGDAAGQQQGAGQ
ncbi:hypothetical protein D3C78_1153590 [compost metagenome]